MESAKTVGVTYLRLTTSSHVPVDPVELLRRFRVRARPLASDGQVRSVPSSDVAPNHPLVRNVVPDLLTQFQLDLEAL